jgi:general secretion pathway protein J
VSRDRAAGVTLVEMLVALVLFALIAVAGFTVLDQVVRVQDGTQGRLDRLAQMQRSMHILTQDLMFASGSSLSSADGAVSFRRSAADGEMSVRYDVEDATLVRSVSGALGARPARQPLLTGVRAFGWSFLDANRQWNARWPAAPNGPKGNPAAVALDLALAGPGLSGELRRVAILPAEAKQ